MCNAYVNKGGCHKVNSQQECQNKCNADSKCQIYEMPAEDNPKYKGASRLTCCLEHCNLDTCEKLDWSPPCGSDGTWHSWVKNSGSLGTYSNSHVFFAKTFY